VSTARWNLKEAEGNTLARRTGTTSELQRKAESKLIRPSDDEYYMGPIA
jgi:hypothetical protein